MHPSKYYDLTSSSALSESEHREMIKGPYRELISALLYLSTRSWPDIAICICFLSRHVRDQRGLHWTEIERVFRYLKGTISYSLLVGLHNKYLSSYIDFDSAGSVDCVPTTGNLVLFSGACIGWKSIKRRFIELSSTGLEYVSLSEVGREILWMKNLCQ